MSTENSLYWFCRNEKHVKNAYSFNSVDIPRRNLSTWMTERKHISNVTYVHTYYYHVHTYYYYILLEPWMEGNYSKSGTIAGCHFLFNWVIFKSQMCPRHKNHWRGRRVYRIKMKSLSNKKDLHVVAELWSVWREFFYIVCENGIE